MCNVILCQLCVTLQGLSCRQKFEPEPSALSTDISMSRQSRPSNSNAGGGGTVYRTPATIAGFRKGVGLSGVGSGQLCRSAPASGPLLSLPTPGCGAGRPRCRPRTNCHGPSESPTPVGDSLTPRRAAGPGARTGLTVTAPRPAWISTVCRRSTGAGRPQCRPRADCEGCAYPCDPRPAHPHTHTWRARLAVSGPTGRRLGRAAGRDKAGATRGHVTKHQTDQTIACRVPYLTSRTGGRTGQGRRRARTRTPGVPGAEHP